MFTNLQLLLAIPHELPYSIANGRKDCQEVDYSHKWGKIPRIVDDYLKFLLFRHHAAFCCYDAYVIVARLQVVECEGIDTGRHAYPFAIVYRIGKGDALCCFVRQGREVHGDVIVGMGKLEFAAVVDCSIAYREFSRFHHCPYVFVADKDFCKRDMVLPC